MYATFDVHLTLTCDKPNSMDFMDRYAGLENVWYKFEVDVHGRVTLKANADRFEHLAQYFLKMARSEKMDVYHGHHSLELGEENNEGSELRITFRES